MNVNIPPKKDLKCKKKVVDGRASLTREELRRIWGITMGLMNAAYIEETRHGGV